jgi:hypothetical protein
MFEREHGAYQSMFTGQQKGARAFVLKCGFATVEQLATMTDDDVDALISERYISAVELNGVVRGGNGMYEEIVFIPKADWEKYDRINR